MKRTLVLTFFVLAALLWGETVINGSRSILGAWNAGGASSTIPAKVGTGLPATCVVGEQFFRSDAQAGQNIHLCTAENTWTQVSGAGSSGSSEAWCLPGDLRWVCAVEEFISGGTASLQAGQLGWWHTSGTFSVQTGARPHYGVARMTTGTTSGNSGIIALHNTTYPIGNVFADTTKVWDTKFVFKLGQTSDIGFRVGFGQSASGWSLVGIGMAAGATGGDFGVTAGTGGSEQAMASFGVALDTNWHTFRVYSDGTANKIYATLDGGTPVTVCPSGCTITVAAGSSLWTSASAGTPWFYVRTDTSAARHIDADYWSFRSMAGASEVVR